MQLGFLKQNIWNVLKYVFRLIAFWHINTHTHTSTDGLCIKMTSKYQYDTILLIEINSENKCRHRLNGCCTVLFFFLFCFCTQENYILMQLIWIYANTEVLIFLFKMKCTLAIINSIHSICKRTNNKKKEIQWIPKNFSNCNIVIWNE